MLAAFLCSCLFVSSVTAQGSGISQAKETIKNCYEAVLQAEAAGANVDALMVTLNDAASSLSQAELYYASGDYDAASNAASQCQSQLSGFISQANAEQANAQAASSQNLLLTIVFSVVSLAVFVSGVTAWVVLNRRERRSPHGSGTL